MTFLKHPGYPVTCICSAAIFLIVASCLSSCNKEGSGNSGTPFELITGSTWQLNAMYLTDSPYVQLSDFTSQFYAPCELSDVYLFKTDSSLSRKRSDTTNPCTPASTVVPDDGATWYIDGITGHMIIGKQTFSAIYRYNCEILELNSSTMRLRSKFINYFGHPSAYIFSFRASR